MKGSRISPMHHDTHLSMRSINSQELLEAALREFIETNKTAGLCKGDAITNAGKKTQLLKMLGLTMTPLVVLLGVTFYFLAESAAERAENNRITSAVGFSVELANCIHYLQLERDQSVLYLSNIGPETKYFLFQRYMETDQELERLSRWPTNLDLKDRPQFKSLKAFQIYLSNHRQGLDLSSHNVYDEMDFYTYNIQIFILWLYNSITESRFGTIWKTLVAYQKIVSGKEEVGIERALGSAFFYRGGFDNHEIYLRYIKKTNTFGYSYRSAQNYSSIVRPIANLKIRNAGMNLTQNLAYYREVIQHKNISHVSEKEATRYYDNMTMYIDILLEIQRSLAKEILEKLDESSQDVTANIIISAVLIFAVLALCPIQIQAVYKQTSDIQSYALTLAGKTKELNQEQRRTDSLLYQMLPRSVADKLKMKKEVNAEYFKDVTICFSDVEGFTKLTSENSPPQVVELLKELYDFFDRVIELYDVYKVETIADQYMITSGVPNKNEKGHAIAIANMAMHLIDASHSLALVSLSGGKIRIRIGLHSGPVMAGVVGTKLPRFCLFGDTVNTASRMQSNSVANKIHVSSSTHRLLAKTGDYTFDCRGPIAIKGKGTMTTYWLTGRTDDSGKQLALGGGGGDTGTGSDRKLDDVIEVTTSGAYALDNNATAKGGGGGGTSGPSAHDDPAPDYVACVVNEPPVAVDGVTRQETGGGGRTTDEEFGDGHEGAVLKQTLTKRNDSEAADSQA